MLTLVQGHTTSLQMGVNPCGLLALQVWLTDVTHVSEFGHLKYMHVSMDTFSSAIWVSVHTGESSRDAFAHWHLAFAPLGIPHTIKTDNGPAHISQSTRHFLQLWGVFYHTGIPHSPMGQAIIERAHGTLKRMLEKQKQRMCGETPQSRVTKELYTLNHLTIPANSQNPVILNNFLLLQSSSDHSPKPKVLITSLPTNGNVPGTCYLGGQVHLYFHRCWHPVCACWVCGSCSTLCSGSHPTTSP